MIALQPAMTIIVLTLVMVMAMAMTMTMAKVKAMMMMMLGDLKMPKEFFQTMISRVFDNR